MRCKVVQGAAYCRHQLMPGARGVELVREVQRGGWERAIRTGHASVRLCKAASAESATCRSLNWQNWLPLLTCTDNSDELAIQASARPADARARGDTGDERWRGHGGWEKTAKIGGPRCNLLPAASSQRCPMRGCTGGIKAQARARLQSRLGARQNTGRACRACRACRGLSQGCSALPAQMARTCFTVRPMTAHLGLRSGGHGVLRHGRRPPAARITRATRK